MKNLALGFEPIRNWEIFLMSDISVILYRFFQLLVYPRKMLQLLNYLWQLRREKKKQKAALANFAIRRLHLKK